MINQILDSSLAFRAMPPRETRKRVCRSLVMLKNKKLENPWRNLGNISL